VTTKDGNILLWNSDSLVGTLFGHTSFVSCLAFSPAGTMLASGGGHEKVVRLRDLTTDVCPATLTGHTEEMYKLVVSPPSGSLLASCSQDKKIIRLWDMSSHACVARLTRVIFIAFTPDGRTLISGGVHTALRQCDVASRSCTATLRGHTSAAYCVAICPLVRDLG
jgi:WD40 repeat protein